jgi:hypothetical protein
MYLLPQFCIFERLPKEMRESQALKDLRKQYSTLTPEKSHEECNRLAKDTSDRMKELDLGMEMDVRPMEVIARTMPPPKICVNQVRESIECEREHRV